MSPRRAERSDEELLARAVRVVRRYGPRVTLARIAADLGLSSARLIQRFGSRGRLLAAVEERADRRLLESIMADLDRADPLGALIDRLATVAERNAKRLYLLSNSYFYDPGHAVTTAGVREARQRIETFVDRFAAVLDRAAAAGQLTPNVDRRALARALNVAWVGSYNAWAYAPLGSLRHEVARDLEFVVAPYRVRPSSRRKRSR